MASGSPEPGRDRNPNLTRFTPGPGGLIDQQAFDEARRRADRATGIALLVLGIGVTVMNMAMLTENALAAQYAAVFSSYGIAPYARPEGLAALSLAGIVGHPLIYAATLYTCILRWRRGKRALWVIILGSLASMALTFAIITLGMTMHPELAAVIEQGALPTATATP